MMLLGAAVLILLAGFIVQFIVTLLEVLAVIVGVILLLGGLALLILGGRGWRRRPWGWDAPPSNT